MKFHDKHPLKTFNKMCCTVMFSCLMCKLHIISWVYSELWCMTCKSDSSCMNPHTHMSQVIAKPQYYWVLWFFLSWLLSWFKRNKTNPSTIHPSQLHFHGFATIFKFAAKKQQITYHFQVGLPNSFGCHQFIVTRFLPFSLLNWEPPVNYRSHRKWLQ